MILLDIEKFMGSADMGLNSAASTAAIEAATEAASETVIETETATA